ncbi:MAG TPA: hypothetical protein VF898_08075 [Chloroflexota bacterium]
MSEVGKVTIEPIARPGGIFHHVSATVNVGGSLVSVNEDSEQDRELAELVDRLYTKLSAMGVETVRASLHHDRG